MNMQASQSTILNWPSGWKYHKITSNTIDDGPYVWFDNTMHYKHNWWIIQWDIYQLFTDINISLNKECVTKCIVRKTYLLTMNP